MLTYYVREHVREHVDEQLARRAGLSELDKGISWAKPQYQ